MTDTTKMTRPPVHDLLESSVRPIDARGRWVGVLMLACSLLAGGCEATPNREIAEARMQAEFQDGVTTREQAVLRLGTPSAEFENGRILTYLLTVDTTNQMRPVPRQQAVMTEQALRRWQGVTHNLVLVFRADGVLERHSILKVPE